MEQPHNGIHETSRLTHTTNSTTKNMSSFLDTELTITDKNIIFTKLKKIRSTIRPDRSTDYLREDLKEKERPKSNTGDLQTLLASGPEILHRYSSISHYFELPKEEQQQEEQEEQEQEEQEQEQEEQEEQEQEEQEQEEQEQEEQE
ncbi:hypothetical protein ElyMa_001383000 [Elysia marginata]|uniref:Uncharacterized protein n=1 Tax=Elysia marginata TaxID=1093978 RepID=A0AAV4IT87_9GAST|nr:hypothetical protein ElyMa_001383000 [Elysia marginata]